LCVWRSTGAADLLRHVRLVWHWRGGIRYERREEQRGRRCKERRRPRGQWLDEGATLIRVSACSSLAGVGKPWRPVALLVPSCFVAQAVELECRAPRPRQGRRRPESWLVGGAIGGDERQWAAGDAAGGGRTPAPSRRAEGARSCGARWWPCPARLRGRAQLARGLRHLADGCRPYEPEKVREVSG
jgi:hypothetical protein